MSDKKTDRVELQGGIVHLPAEFREVARKANQAGLEGWQFVDLEYGIDLDEAHAVLASDPAELSFPESRAVITYERASPVRRSNRRRDRDAEVSGGKR